MIILAFGCSSPPLDEVRQAEARFYDADLLAEAGVALVDVEDGEPLKHTVRIVIGPDHVDVDNRAWWLAERAETDLERTHLVVRERVLSVQNLADSDPLEGPLRAALDAIVATLPEPSASERPVQIWAHHDTTGEQVKAAVTTASYAGFGHYQLIARVGTVPRAVLASRPPPFQRKPCAVHLAHWTEPDRGHWLEPAGNMALVRDDSTMPPEAIVPFVQEIHATCEPIWDRAESELADSPYVPTDARSWQCVSMGNGLPTGVPISRVYPVMAAGYAAWPDIVAKGFYAALNFGRFKNVTRLDALDADALERLCLGPLALLTRPDDKQVLKTFGFHHRRLAKTGELVESYSKPTPMRLHKILRTQPDESK
jgi:hypothetical protein